jgi:hypothetical protein
MVVQDSWAEEEKMPVTSRDQFRVSVILYPEDGFWIAQGIEFDITARGRSPIEASERFSDKFAAEYVISIEVGDSEPLAGVGAAPQEFWTMYKNATMRVVVDETSFRLAGGPASQVRPEMRIADRRLAA